MRGSLITSKEAKREWNIGVSLRRNGPRVKMEACNPPVIYRFWW